MYLWANMSVSCVILCIFMFQTRDRRIFKAFFKFISIKHRFNLKLKCKWPPEWSIKMADKTQCTYLTLSASNPNIKNVYFFSKWQVFRELKMLLSLFQSNALDWHLILKLCIFQNIQVVIFLKHSYLAL